MRELLIIRHGATEANERRVFAGATDLPLSPAGAQAVLARRERFPQATRFFSSGMLRANQTLQLLYGDVPYMVIPELAEYCFGIFEGRGHADLAENEPLYQQWLDDAEVACPGGESRNAFEARIATGWATLCAQPWEGLAVLIAHGGVISGIMRTQIQSEEYPPTPQNVEGYRITFTDDGRVYACEDFA